MDVCSFFSQSIIITLEKKTQSQIFSIANENYEKVSIEQSFVRVRFEHNSVCVVVTFLFLLLQLMIFFFYDSPAHRVCVCVPLLV